MRDADTEGLTLGDDTGVKLLCRPSGVTTGLALDGALGKAIVSRKPLSEKMSGTEPVTLAKSMQLPVK